MYETWDENKTVIMIPAAVFRKHKYTVKQLYTCTIILPMQINL